MFSKPYEIVMCGKGGNGGNAVNLYLGGNGGGALTGYKKLYIEASDVWTAVFSSASGGTCSFANIANTLQAQNGYNGATDGYQTSTAGGSSHAGFDRVVPGRYANASNGGDSELGIGGENGIILNSITGGNGKGYGAGAGAGHKPAGVNGIGGTGAPAVIIIRG